MRKAPLGLAFMLAMGLPAAAQSGLDAAGLADAVAAGNDAATAGIAAHYRDAGISINDTLVWRSQPFDEIINWYNDLTEEIMLSEMPPPDQVAAYWDNWSAVLTDGRWDWRAFFEDFDDAGEMANFNQFVLGAHEFGHALTYRYDSGHVRREDNEINCREYPADRLAAGLLAELAAEEDRFAKWRQRYGELVRAINSEISKSERYEISDFAALESDCHVISIVQPTETTLTPYASAYFARWSVLLEADLPALAALYETHLLSYWRPLLEPSLERAGAVSTIGSFMPGLQLDGSVRHDDGTQWVVPGFAPDGSLYVMDYFNGGAGGDNTLTFEVAYGPALAAKRKPVLERTTISLDNVDGAYVDFTSMLPLGPDEFLIATSDWLDFAGDLVLARFVRRDGGWRHTIVQPLPGVDDTATRLLAGDGGPVLAVQSPTGPGNEHHWVEYAIDRETLALGPGTPRFLARGPLVGQTPWGEPIYADDDFRAFFLGSERERIAGNRLEGFKNGAALAAEFGTVSAVIVLADRIRVLDLDPQTNAHVVREITLTPP